MATLVITHLGAGSDFDGQLQGPIRINELAVNLAFGSPITTTRPAGSIPNMSSLMALVAASKVSAVVTLSADELASGLVLSANSVSAGDIVAGAVGTVALAAGAVTKAKAAVFISAEQTATGSAQNVAHGLGVAPASVLIVPTAGNNGSGAAGDKTATIAEGSHTTTNVVVTVTAGSKFKVMAWA